MSENFDRELSENELKRIVVAAIKREPELQRLGRQINEGHVKIDVTTPVTSLVYSDELAKHVGTNKALLVSHTENSRGEKGLSVSIPTVGQFPDLLSGLKAAADNVFDAIIEVKRKEKIEQEVDVKTTPKNKVKTKLKM